jgi:predicted NAD/FAD-dependent oxidoreductase
MIVGLMHPYQAKIAILGAGLAGLNLANLLKANAEIVLFEKSDKLGGRMATHRCNGFEFDHGAQYFTAKDSLFKDWVARLVDANVVASWPARFVEIEHRSMMSQRTWDDAFPHFVGIPSMNAIAQHLAGGLDVRFNQLITGIKPQHAKWVLETADGQFGEFDWVVSTLPAEQAKVILPDSYQQKKALQSVQMQPCFTLMLGYDGDRQSAWDAAFISRSILSWVSVNSAKPNRAKPYTLVAMSQNAWARDNFARPEAQIIDELLAELEGVMGEKLGDATYIKLKKWKYANADKQETQLSFVDHAAKLACCGDWCISGRIESAFMSSSRVAETIKASLI